MSWWGKCCVYHLAGEYFRVCTNELRTMDAKIGCCHLTDVSFIGVHIALSWMRSVWSRHGSPRSVSVALRSSTRPMSRKRWRACSAYARGPYAHRRDQFSNPDGEFIRKMISEVMKAMTASTQQLKQALQNSPMADAPEVRAAAAPSLRVLYTVVLSIQSMDAGILSK